MLQSTLRVRLGIRVRVIRVSCNKHIVIRALSMTTCVRPAPHPHLNISSDPNMTLTLTLSLTLIPTLPLSQ